jgi:hypothetical protein
VSDQPPNNCEARAESPKRFSEAAAIATEAGQRIASQYCDLGRKEHLKLVRTFRRQLIKPGKRGPKKKERITAAYVDWKAGSRGVALYRKHIPGFGKMGRWKRKAKSETLLESIRTRDRREKPVPPSDRLTNSDTDFDQSNRS